MVCSPATIAYASRSSPSPPHRRRRAPAVTPAPAEPPAPEVPGDLAALLADLDELDDGEVEALLRKRRG